MVFAGKGRWVILSVLVLCLVGFALLHYNIFLTSDRTLGAQGTKRRLTRPGGYSNNVTNPNKSLRQGGMSWATNGSLFSARKSTRKNNVSLAPPVPKITVVTPVKDQPPSSLLPVGGAALGATPFKSAPQDAYSFLFRIVNLMATSGVQPYLYGRSLLGSRRHHGMVPGDKHISICIFADKGRAQEIFEKGNLNAQTSDFGFQIPFTHNQKVRVWLFKAVGKRAECVGVDNKCRAWLAKHERGSPSGFPLAWFGAPVMVPFGSYAVPAPGLNIEVLKKIAPDWKRPCRSKRPCRVNKKNANWVFYENGGEVLRKGDTTIHFLKFSNGNFSKEHATPSRPKVPKRLDKFNWRNCDDFRGTNISHGLYLQLQKIVKAFEQTNTDYVMSFGSLLGMVRDNGINPQEVDNDFIVHKHFKPSPQVYKALFDHGLIMFRYDIWRICNYRRTPSSDGRVPWKGRYVIFSDVYTALPNLILLHSMHGARPVFKRKWTRSTMRVGDVDVNTPDLASSKAFLARVYGRYMTVKMELNWKSRVRAQVKRRRL